MDKDALIRFLTDEYELNKGNAEANRPAMSNMGTGSWYDYGYWCGIKEYLAGLITWLQDDEVFDLTMEMYK